MSVTRKVIVLACVLALVGLAAWAGGDKKLPAGPAFDSAVSPKDEGTVAPSPSNLPAHQDRGPGP